jgi:putative tryptophan/tyrosine transport system substrate-binding protein
MMRPTIGLLLTLALSLLVAPLTAQEPPAKVARIGCLVSGGLDSPETRVLLDAFRQGLRERGYVEGQHIVMEYRAADGQLERFPELATALARLPVDLIIAPNTLAARAAQHATTTIPIVTIVMGDPVSDGLVASLARPGGNITGMTLLAPELVAKRLELLKEALPRVARVAVLWHPDAYAERTTRAMVQATEAAARTLGVHLHLVEVQDPDELDRAFATMAQEHAEALLILPSPMLYTARRRIIDLAARHRLPAISAALEMVELGGLIAYGASIPDLWRRAATYVDKILKGTTPADLPVEQPITLELVINLKTAQALGLTIPPTLLFQADKVIR